MHAMQVPTRVVKRVDVDLLAYSNISLLEMGTMTDEGERLWVRTSHGYAHRDLHIESL